MSWSLFLLHFFPDFAEKFCLIEATILLHLSWQSCLCRFLVYITLGFFQFEIRYIYSSKSFCCLPGSATIIHFPGENLKAEWEVAGIVLSGSQCRAEMTVQCFMEMKYNVESLCSSETRTRREAWEPGNSETWRRDFTERGVWALKVVEYDHLPFISMAICITNSCV